MGELSIWRELVLWLAALPVRLAYRIIWLTGLLGSRNARDVQRAMWDAGLSVPMPRAALTGEHNG
jgi:hypothetical protein